jgi:putative ABC transport system ATP-binding protein
MPQASSGVALGGSEIDGAQGIAAAAVPPLVALENVSRTFDGGQIVGLKDVSFGVSAGELVAICGQSGSGKSTMVNMMSGIDGPTAGAVVFAGERNPTSRRWADHRRGPIGIVFQDFNLLPTLTAVENVEVAMFGRAAGPAERRRKALELLDRVGIVDCARRFPPQMSGGQRRRVSIARGMVNDAVLLLADEPTSNLDTASGRAVMDLLLEVHARSAIALVIVTHDHEVMARCRRRVVMRDGRIVEDVSTGPMAAP